MSCTQFSNPRFLPSLEEKVVGPALKKAEELQRRRQKLREKMF